MSSNAITASTAISERTATRRGRRSIPWSTVLPLAVVMAFADGFWLTSLRGAVGAIERTQGPFAAWLRESTLVLPAFVLAVLGALMLATRLFGSEQRTSRAILATALLVAAAGTVVGIAEIAASSAYDYLLQSHQLRLMSAVRHGCAGGDCLAQQQHASLALQVRAVGYGSALVLVTNTLLVGWVVAVRGGRVTLAGLPADDAPGRRLYRLRLLLGGAVFGIAAILAAVVPGHLIEWAVASAFFVVLAAA